VVEFVPLVVSPLEQNCYLVFCPKTKETAIVDAGDEPDKIIGELNRRGLVPKYLVNTHCHLDHVSAVAALQERLGLPFWVHPKEGPILENLRGSQSYFGFGDGRQPRPTGELKGGMQLPLGETFFEVIETPGHTPGGVCLKIEGELFTGDTLFAGSIGRSDLPGGNGPQLLVSIKTRLLALDPQLKIHPGHGPSSTLGAERLSNPFLVGMA